MNKTARKPQMCSKCDEQPAIVRATVTTLDGSVLDTAVLCRDCYNSASLVDTLTIGDVVSSPLNDLDL